MSRSFDKVKRDYLKLINKYGFPYDMTGGFVDAERMEKVILNPTKKNAADYMVDVICYGFQMGKYYRSETNGNISIHDDEFLMELYEEYV